MNSIRLSGLQLDWNRKLVMKRKMICYFVSDQQLIITSRRFRKVLIFSKNVTFVNERKANTKMVCILLTLMMQNN
jgi:hypothetical protein